MFKQIDALLEASTSDEIEEMERETVTAFCPLKRGMCGEPWDCDTCPAFQRDVGRVRWVCPSCRARDQAVMPFYTAKACSSCGRFSIFCSPLGEWVG